MSAHTFTCPDCTARLEFDDRQRSMTIQHGCPLCGRPIAHGEFEARGDLEM